MWAGKERYGRADDIGFLKYTDQGGVMSGPEWKRTLETIHNDLLMKDLGLGNSRTRCNDYRLLNRVRQSAIRANLYLDGEVEKAAFALAYDLPRLGIEGFSPQFVLREALLVSGRTAKTGILEGDTPSFKETTATFGNFGVYRRAQGIIPDLETYLRALSFITDDELMSVFGLSSRLPRRIELPPALGTAYRDAEKSSIKLDPTLLKAMIVMRYNLMRCRVKVIQRGEEKKMPLTLGDKGLIVESQILIGRMSSLTTCQERGVFAK